MNRGKVLSTIAVICVFVPSISAARAQAGAKRCPTGEVRLVSVTPVFNADALLDGAPKGPFQKMLPRAPGASSREEKIITLGPVLGSMDSHDLETVVSCNHRGFTVRAIITRSVYYNGSALKNVLWRPKIEIAVVPTQSAFMLEVTWAMRLSNGALVHHDQMMPQQHFPITVSSTFH